MNQDFASLARACDQLVKNASEHAKNTKMKAQNFVLQRYSDDTFTTLGLLLQTWANVTVPKFKAFILEDTRRDVKIPGVTRIPAGMYEIKFMEQETPLTRHYRDDKRFKDFFTYHLWLVGVPGFSGVYIHVGNYDKDTEGCLLVGDAAFSNTVNEGNEGHIGSSAVCYTRLYKQIKAYLNEGYKCYLTIRDEEQIK